MNVAITGASGFLGRRLTRSLQASGHTVRAVSLRLPPTPDVFAGCDAVVNLAVSDALYRRHPLDDEGVLSARRAAIVSTPGLARLAARLDLGQFLLLGEGEAQRGGRVRPSLLASAFEALIGAIYLDQGWPVVSDFIGRYIISKLAFILEHKLYVDPKSRFQEAAQETAGITPSYKVLSETGPDHAKEFVVGVFLGSELVASGKGMSKQDAQIDAARKALEAKGW